MVDVESFLPGDPEFQSFRAFAEELYAGDPFWSHPGYETGERHAGLFFLARAGGSIVGRACAMLTQLRWEGGIVGVIGFYECLDDDEAARALLDAAAEHLRIIGCRYLIGPMNGSTWHRYRFAEPSAEPPFFMDVYHKPWYPEQWERCGFAPIATYHSSRGPAGGASDRIAKFTRLFAERGVTIRELRPDDYEREMERIYEVSAESFHGSPFYTPIAFEEFAAIYREARPVVDPRLVLIAEREERPVGFLLALPNLFERGRRSLVVKTVAVRPEPGLRGLGTLLVETIHERAGGLGWEEVIHALMHERNASLQIASEGMTVHRIYRLYGRPA